MVVGRGFGSGDITGKSPRSALDTCTNTFNKTLRISMDTVAG